MFAKALKQVRARTPVLVVEQNTGMALALCDNAFVLVQGEIKLRGASSELGDREELLASYLGQTDVGHQQEPSEHH